MGRGCHKEKKKKKKGKRSGSSAFWRVELAGGAT